FTHSNVFYRSAGYTDFVLIGRDSGTDTYNSLSSLNGNSDDYLYIQSNNLVGASDYLVNPPSDCDLSSNATNAIDGAYTSNWTPSQDFHGTSMFGPLWDIGYDEFNSTHPPDPDPPQPPTGIRIQ
ncbi:MAG: hypothetical protein ACFFCW_26470, partial [Candidatus Hodarchaeota archaeon]